MDLQRATERAARIARKRGEWAYVVWSNEPDDIPGQHYHPASEESADTFYAGCSIVTAIGPDGRPEAS